MALSETNEIRYFKCCKFNDLQDSFDMVTNELQKVIDAYNKISQEKKDWQILLEASLTELYLLAEELGNVKVQLNSIKKSPNHKSVGYNRTTFKRRRYSNQSSKKSIKSTSNSFYYFAETSINFFCYTCGGIGHKSLKHRKLSSGKLIGRPKDVNVNPQGPKNTWVKKYLGTKNKLINLFCRSILEKPPRKECGWIH